MFHQNLHRLGMAMGLALLFACGGTTTQSTMVKRAAWIDFGDAKTVQLDLGFECTDVWIRPDKAERRLYDEKSEGKGVVGGIGVKTKSGFSIGLADRAREEKSCTDSVFGQGVFAQTMKILVDRLSSQKIRVVPTGGDATLKADVHVMRVRDVMQMGSYQDSGKDKRCTKKCGAPKCLKFHHKAEVVLKGVFVGPSLSNGEIQRVDRFTKGDALTGRRDEIRYPGCKIADEVATVRNEKVYDFDRGKRDVMKWMQTTSKYMFSSYSEEYDLKLFDVSDNPANSRGKAHAKARNWTKASESFATAVSRAPAGDKETKAQLLHNLAAALMSARKLDAARDRVRQSLALDDDSDTKSLREEIKRRRTDALKLP